MPCVYNQPSLIFFLSSSLQVIVDLIVVHHAHEFFFMALLFTRDIFVSLNNILHSFMCSILYKLYSTVCIFYIFLKLFWLLFLKFINFYCCIVFHWMNIWQLFNQCSVNVWVVSTFSLLSNWQWASLYMSFCAHVWEFFSRVCN